MPINFDTEMQEITANLVQVEGYLDCEKIIIQNIRKHLNCGRDDRVMEEYLKKMSYHIWHHTGSNRTNSMYAAGFVDTLLRMPCWKIWMNTISN